MTNELFIDMLKLASPSNPELLEHARKLVAVAEAARQLVSSSIVEITDDGEMNVEIEPNLLFILDTKIQLLEGGDDD